MVCPTVRVLNDGPLLYECDGNPSGLTARAESQASATEGNKREEAKNSAGESQPRHFLGRELMRF